VRLLGIAIGLSILGSLGGIIVASSFLLLGEKIRVRLVPWLISYAVGTLIGVALLALVPEALAELPARPAMLTMAAGILSFFLLEKAVIWRHCHHDEDCHVHSTAASLVIVGDAFHTFVDGAVIAAAATSASTSPRCATSPTTAAVVPRSSAGCATSIPPSPASPTS